MTSTALVGSTGLVGSHILTTLLSLPSISAVHAYSRRELPKNNPSEKLYPLTSTDTSSWPSLFPKQPPTPNIFISALGTTRAAAGGTDKQYAIDYTLNLDLARAAKEAGVAVYVLISSNEANHKSSFFYPRMKGELEEAVKELGFEYTVILRPGLIVGDREDSRVAEGIFRSIATGVGKISSALKDSWAQDADVIARAAVRAGLDCAEGKRTEKGVWMVEQSDIVRLGRTEWKETEN